MMDENKVELIDVKLVVDDKGIYELSGLRIHNRTIPKFGNRFKT